MTNFAGLLKGIFHALMVGPQLMIKDAKKGPVCSARPHGNPFIGL
jgi:hypothetical protein